MDLVGHQQVRQQRNVDVVAPCGVSQRPDVLGQARAAERESRPKVGGADVQLGVGEEDIHHGVRVQPQRRADGADLVGEPDFERVEAVVDVLGHLRDADGDPEARAGKALVESHHHFAAAWIRLADNGFGWIEEISNARTLAQELGIHANPEVDPRPLARRRSSRGISRSSQVPGTMVLR